MTAELCRETRVEIDQMLDELAQQASAGEAGEPVLGHPSFDEQVEAIKQKLNLLMHESNAFGRCGGLIPTSGIIF